MPRTRLLPKDAAMEDLLKYIVEGLIDTDEIKISKRTGHHSITLDLRIPQSEAGKVIGRNGRVVKAIRDVLGIVGARQNKRVHLEVNS